MWEHAAGGSAAPPSAVAADDFFSVLVSGRVFMLLEELSLMGAWSL